MKKNYHITVNITEAEYTALTAEAEKQQRPTASLARLWLVENILKYTCNNYGRVLTLTRADGSPIEKKEDKFF